MRWATLLRLLLLCSLIIFSSHDIFANDPIQNSCGIITTYFERGLPRQANGFVVRKNNRIYFLSVLHVSKSFGQSNELKSVDLQLPNLIPYRIRKKPSKADFLDGDTIKTKRPHETVDVLAIDITNEFKELVGTEAVSRIIPFEAIAGIDNKETIVKGFDKELEIAGYRAFPDRGIGLKAEYSLAKINPAMSKDGYGAVVRISKDEAPSGFWMDIKTEHGDCGRPVILRNNSDYIVMGFIKTGDEKLPLSFVIDGTAIIRTLELKD